jgi:hypothetical protein
MAKVKVETTLDLSLAPGRIGNPTKRTFSYKSFTERLVKKADEGTQEQAKAKLADSLLEAVIRHNDDILTKVENDLKVMLLHDKYGHVLFDDRGKKRVFIRTDQVSLLRDNKSVSVHMHIF